MRFTSNSSLLLTFPVLSFASPLTPRDGPNCKDVTFTLTASATNRLALNPPANFQDINIVVPFLLQPDLPNPVSGTQKIYGQYCEPTTKIPGRQKTIQLLVPGNTYSHAYFNGFTATPSDPTSWAGFFNKIGYATLSIDRLGIGRSSKPDPLNVVQAPYQAALYAELVKLLKSNGQLPGGIPNSWSKVIWVGHSYGSIIGTQVSAKYPSADIAAFVQTGLAVPKTGQNALPGELADAYVPAATFDPVRFPPATYPPGYLVASSKAGRQSTFYSVPQQDFSPAKYDEDFKTEETITLGETLTQDLYTSDSYSGPVFVLTGRADAVFCGNGARELGIPDCGEGANSQLAALKTFYPSVPRDKFKTYTQPNAGHCHQIHYTAPWGYAKVEEFLQSQGI